MNTREEKGRAEKGGGDDILVRKARAERRFGDDFEQNRRRACSGVHREMEESEGDANGNERRVRGASDALTGRVAGLLDHGHGQRGI